MGVFNMIGLAIFAWLFAEAAEPIQWLKAKVGLTTSNMLGRLFHCSLCFGFYLFLGAAIYTIGLEWSVIMYASIGAIMSELVSRIMNRI